MNMIKQVQKNIKRYQYKNNMKGIARTVAISTASAIVTTVIVALNAEKITRTLNGGKSSVKEYFGTRAQYIKDKTSQVAEAAEKTLKDVKHKVSNIKEELAEGIKEADDIVEDAKADLTKELEQVGRKAIKEAESVKANLKDEVKSQNKKV